MGIRNILNIRKQKKKRLTLIDMQAHQCRCMYRGKDCPYQFTMHRRKWCGIDSRLNFECDENRKQPDIPA